MLLNYMFKACVYTPYLGEHSSAKVFCHHAESIWRTLELRTRNKPMILPQTHIMLSTVDVFA